jgi:hypothetical protein
VLSVAEAERKLFQTFRRQILPARLLTPVADAYFSGEAHTFCALLNASASFT